MNQKIFKIVSFFISFCPLSIEVNSPLSTKNITVIAKTIKIELYSAVLSNCIEIKSAKNMIPIAIGIISTSEIFKALLKSFV